MVAPVTVAVARHIDRRGAAAQALTLLGTLPIAAGESAVLCLSGRQGPSLGAMSATLDQLEAAGASSLEVHAASLPRTGRRARAVAEELFGRAVRLHHRHEAIPGHRPAVVTWSGQDGSLETGRIASSLAAADACVLLSGPSRHPGAGLAHGLAGLLDQLRTEVSKRAWLRLLGGGDEACWADESTQARAIVALASLLRPRLSIVSDLPPARPRRDDRRSEGAVAVAGTDPVAVDAVAAHLRGVDPTTIPHLVLAVSAGLGTVDLKRIRLVGDSPEGLVRRLRFGGRPAYVPTRGVNVPGPHRPAHRTRIRS